MGAVGVYDKSRQAATADRWFIIVNVTQNGNGQRYVKYDTDVFASKEDAENHTTHSAHSALSAERRCTVLAVH